MNNVLADTNAIIWHLSDPSRLTTAAAKAVTTAEATGIIYVATITFIEMTYLVEKGRLDAAIQTGLWSAVRDPGQPVKALPLALDVAAVLDQIPRGAVPDMPDRIIAATALAHALPLVTADRRIRALTIPMLSVIW